MEKLTTFKSIPKFTNDGAWECDFGCEEVVDFIFRKQTKFGLNLDPDFQRHHVWTEEQQIQFMEFFFRGGKTGRVIYLNNPGWMKNPPKDYSEFVLVDGKQRLRAVERFVNNEIPIFGSFKKEFTDRVPFFPTFRVNVNTLGSRAEVLQWYLDMNTGGTIHSNDEIVKVKQLLKLEKLK